MSPADLGETALATVQALASVVVLYIIGVAFVALGHLDAKSIAVIANLVKLIFVPSIIIGVVGGGLTASELQENSLLLVGGLFTVAVGFLCGQIIVPFAKVADSFRPWFVMGAAFPNMLALPVVFIEAVCQSEENQHDEQSKCATNAESRLFTFVLVFPFLEWGLGSAYVWYCQRSLPGQDAEMSVGSDSTPSRGRGAGKTANKPESAVLETSSDLEMQQHPSSDSRQSTGRISPGEQDGQLLWLFNKAVLTNPPVVAVFGSLALVFCPTARSFLFGHGAPLLFASSALHQIANATPAIMNLVTAGTLGCHVVRLQGLKGIFGGHGTGLNIRTVVLLATCRVIVVPSIVLGTLFLCRDSLPNDKWLRRLLYIVPMSPTASAVVSLAHALGQPLAAEHLASTLLFQFLLYPLVMMMSMMLGPMILGV
jgi:predicted permease